MANSSTSSSGIGLVGVLGIVFIVLKLAGVVDWSWLWVLSPFWIDFLFIALVLVVMKLGKHTGGDMPPEEEP